jgi:protein SCO1/2
MSRKKLFYISFFVVLALSFYFILTALVPELGKKRIPPVSYVRDFSFINQDGETVTNADLEGKVYVAEYFFTSCKGICPDMNNNMRLVYEAFKDDPGFLIVSHTSDPDVDSAAVLKQFADSMQVNTDKWMFLTGRKDSLYNMARLSYTIDDPANNLKSIDDDFLHTQFWALVDRKGKVRKIYDGLKESEVRELIRDARKFLKEKV